MSVLQKKDKEDIKVMGFLKPEQLRKEMNDLLKYYGTDISSADLKETRRILSRVSPLNKELVDMREENP